jgi:hypothetical protein
MKRLLVVAVVAVVISSGFAGCRNGEFGGCGSRLFGRGQGDPCCPCDPCGGGGEMIIPSSGAAVIETVPAPPATLPGPARTNPG